MPFKAYLYVCVYVHTHMYIQIYAHTQHTYIHTYMHTYICIWWAEGAPEISANLSEGGTHLAMYLVGEGPGPVTWTVMRTPPSSGTGCRRSRMNLA